MKNNRFQGSILVKAKTNCLAVTTCKTFPKSFGYFELFFVTTKSNKNIFV